ncbi:MULTISPECIES: AbrB family transcriptional regulator [Nitrosomonas]|uniref:antitoxin n=1 Tax=Nitrosomonas TaxID=914 RepID=UPI0019352791|nr:MULTISPECIES: AbrB family transcriptional regulator [Nitrosomonas]QOJ09998.1 MAG: AbrB/MazE/SpoVT family DNA-binding domain-containing protein [Nitrosomonas sp. H1_AOB3]HRN83052.1 AbrB family transcriptional regulator [Nitrosomonas europaea]HRO57502.1 AbrB family transcriptional regulator [Nitrosomonas europaea]HUM74992.1 AbrB family transcriptional regulator [Nitrosomonas europaea]
METAKICWTGRSQAIRLPKKYRIDGDEVRIRRYGTAIILESIPTDWAWLDALSAPIDADFKQTSEEQDVLQEHPELDDLFN